MLRLVQLNTGFRSLSCRLLLSTKLVTPRFWYSQDNSKAEEIFKRKLIAREKEFRSRLPQWEKRDISLKKRYGVWNPTKKVSRVQMQDIRSLKLQMPNLKTVDMANMFGVSPESIRRILNSKWQPSENDMKKLEKRAERRKAESRERKEQSEQDLKDGVRRIHRAKTIKLQNVRYKETDAINEKDTSKKTASKRQLHAVTGKQGKMKTTIDKPFVPSVADLIK